MKTEGCAETIVETEAVVEPVKAVDAQKRKCEMRRKLHGSFSSQQHQEGSESEKQAGSQRLKLLVLKRSKRFSCCCSIPY
ncbi:hypothetical protein O9992_02970 [Vibrio lentus]|nr:hypothetical protein [Vibrio lentus]